MFEEASMANSVDPDQTAPLVCSGSMLFTSILNLSGMLGNFLQQTTSADNIFKCIFFLGTLRVNIYIFRQKVSEYDQEISQSHSRPTHGTVRKSHRTFIITISVRQ